MTFARTALAFTFILSSASAACAAATQIEADAIKGALEKYVGKAPGFLSVTPQGDAYEMVFGSTSPVSGPAGSGLIFKFTPLHFMLRSLGDGKWQVDQDQPLALNVNKDGKDVFDYTINTHKMSGVWDEAVGSFSKAVFDGKGFLIAQNIPEPGGGLSKGETSVSTAGGEMGGTRSQSGAADFTAKYEMKGWKSKDAVNFAEGQVPIEYSYTIDSVVTQASGTSFKNKEVLGLMAWFVAHQSKESITRDQAELKTLLTAAMPLFDHLEGTYDFSKIAVKAAGSEFKVKSATAGLEANGFVHDGLLRETVKFEGLKLPPGLYPAWSEKLVPDSASLDVAISGFNADAVAALAIKEFDLSKEPPIADRKKPEFLKALLPDGTFRLILKPSTITSSIYALSYEADIKGEIAGRPSGTGKLKLKGFDKVVAVLENGAASDPKIQQAIAVLLGAKGFARNDGDELVWAMEITPAGSVFINGIDVTKMTARQ